MDLGLSQKVVVITGGASGIGVASVRLFADEGARVAIVDRNGEAAGKVAQDIGENALAVTAELTNADACRLAVEEVAAAWGGIDVLVNNAGFNDAVSLDRPPEEFLRSMTNNVIPTHGMTHYAKPYLSQSQGSIVNIGSKVSVTGQGGTSGYAAAKGAINALTREWALALAPDGIRVNAVLPAECLTPSYEKWFQAQPDPEAAQASVSKMIPLEKRLTRPEEVAAMIVFLASPRSSHTTGQIIFVDGGYTHLDRAFGQGTARWDG